MKINHFFGFLGVIGIMAFANAEQTLEQNPCLYYPESCHSGSSQPKRTINIPSHWGAVAIDSNKNIAGVSENILKGKRVAKKQAIQACKNKGGEDCKIAAVVKNTCIAYGTSDKKDFGIIPVMSGKTRQEAEFFVKEACRSHGETECKIYYSHCNKDPRYDMY